LSDPVKFVKENYGDQVDQIDTGVAITRGIQQGIYNPLEEESYDGDVSPVNNNVSQLFINGTLVGSNLTVSGEWGTPPAEFRLASEAGGGNQSENLRMATFRYHTRARTPAEILAEFNAERSRFGV
jgi:hypothetical protein